MQSVVVVLGWMAVVVLGWTTMVVVFVKEGKAGDDTTMMCQ